MREQFEVCVQNDWFEIIHDHDPEKNSESLSSRILDCPKNQFIKKTKSLSFLPKAYHFFSARKPLKALSIQRKARLTEVFTDRYETALILFFLRNFRTGNGVNKVRFKNRYFVLNVPYSMGYTY